MDEMNDDELLEALGVKVETKERGAHTAREERVIAGFEDIAQFRQGAWARAAAWRRARHFRAALCCAARPLAGSSLNASRCWRRSDDMACCRAT